MTLVAYPTKKGTRYGYRFYRRGVLYKRRVGSKALAILAEKRERARLDEFAFEAQWGPLKPQLTPWADAVAKFETAKAVKATLAWDRTRLAWWGTFLADRHVTYLQELGPDVIDQGKAQLLADGMAPGTVQRYLAALRTLCNLAVRRWKLLRENPVDLIDWPEAPAREPAIPTKAQLLALIDRADPALRLLILTAIQTGLRKGQILGIRADDLDAQPGLLRIRAQKRRPERLIPFPDPLRALLQASARPDGRIFPRWFPEDRWRTLRAAVGLPRLWFHHLRHTAGTLLAEAGVGDQIIQRYLGHATPGMVRRYSHPRQPAMREAARVLSLAMAQKGNRTRK